MAWAFRAGASKLRISTGLCKVSILQFLPLLTLQLLFNLAYKNLQMNIIIFESKGMEIRENLISDSSKCFFLSFEYYYLRDYQCFKFLEEIRGD